MEELYRRQFLGGALSAVAVSGIPSGSKAESPGYTMDTYPYKPDNVFTPVFGIWPKVNMDIGLLHPGTGAPTIGFYASLDQTHGIPFGDAWKLIYGKFFGDRSVHDQDRGAMLLIAYHIASHGVPPEHFKQAYNIAKKAWDERPDLRLAGRASNNLNGPEFG